MKLKITILFALVSIFFYQDINAQNSGTDSVFVGNVGGVSNSGRGFQFTPLFDTYITHLGKRVPDASTGTFTWNIWRIDSQSLVYSQVSTSTVSGNYSYEPISGNVKLLAGVQYALILYSTTASYYFGNSTQIDPNFTYHTMRYCNSCFPGNYPFQTLGNYHYGTPDFYYILDLEIDPEDVIICEGEDALFTASRDGADSFRWQQYNGSAWSDIANSDNDSLVLSSPSISMNNYLFRCLVFDTSHIDTTTSASLTFNSPVSISSDPTNTTTVDGYTTVFRTVASGTINSYQWQLDSGSGWTDIGGANLDSLLFTALDSMDGNLYRCIVDGVCSDDTSNAAMLTVLDSMLSIHCKTDTVLPACTNIYTYSLPVANHPDLDSTITYTGALQTFTVPAGVYSLTIEVAGAQGGSVTTTCAATGGKGAIMKGDISVTPNEVLKIMVGGEGRTNGSDAGGGGGTFVTRSDNTPLIIAGGGGGATNNITQCGTNRDGLDAVTGTSGTASANGLVSGGINGNGGGASGGSGGGGGGFYTDGTAGTGLSGNNGKSFLNGGAGGTGNNNDFGGFGGGGAGWWTGGNGGGGGGYSGGGTSGSQPFSGGGGGGSFNAGTNQTNIGGANTGHGYVKISVPIPVTQIAGLPSGSQFPLGVTTNTFRATYGVEVVECSFTVTVVSPPVKLDTITSSLNPSINGYAPMQCANLTVSTSGGTGPVTYTWSPSGSGNPFNVCPTAGTWYRATVTDSMGCTDTMSFKQTVKNAVSPYSGRLYMCHQNNPRRPQLYTITVTQAQVPYYLGLGATLGPCGSSPSKMGESNIVDLEDIYKIYPNPFNTELNIEFFSLFDEEVQITLTDMNGRELKTLMNERVYEGSMNRITTDASDLPSGMYLIRYVSDTDIRVQKVILNR